MDDDFWADNDEDVFGPNDMPENQAEYPEGFFVWDCCKQRGDNKGCERGFHVERECKRKRVRY